METMHVGSSVMRLAPSNDYTRGRKGIILQIDHYKGKAQIHWKLSGNSHPMNRKTWVNLNFLQVCDPLPKNL